jgi:hypothetical protein
VVLVAGAVLAQGLPLVGVPVSVLGFVVMMSGAGLILTGPARPPDQRNVIPDNPRKESTGKRERWGSMPQNRPCNVAWCDHDCRWEFETDGLPPVLSGDDVLARARYLAGFGHPPFRWHSRLWPSGLCLEQNEFLPDADPPYVAEHGRLTISGATRPAQLPPGAGETQPGPHRPDSQVRHRRTLWS